MAKLWQDLAYALRTFAKAPGFAITAVLVLGIGIGANTAVFTIVNDMVLRPLSGRAGELVGVYSHDRTVPDSYRAFSYATYADIRDQNDIFEALMAHTFAMVGEPSGVETRRMFADVVSANYFDTLGVKLAAGRPFSAEEERPGARIPVVIVRYARWEQEGLDPAFIGKTIRLNAEDFTVVGVAPRDFTGTMALVAAEVYVPLGMFDVVVNDIFKNNRQPFSNRANPTLVLAGRLKPGLTDAFVSTRLDTVSRQLEAAYPGENKNQALTVAKLPRMSTSTSPQTDGGLGAFTALLMGLSGVVLVIACLNIANMLLARGAARRRELAVRLAIGAGRTRIVRQLLTESMVLAVAGAAFGLVFSFWTTRALAISFARALPMPVTLTVRPDGMVLGMTMVFAALSTIAFGLGPALKLSRRNLVSDLKDLGGASGSVGRRFGARNMMVIGQVALSLALLTAGGIFARTALNAAGSTPGYSYDRLVLATLDASLAAYNEPQARALYRRVTERTRAMPEVTAVSTNSTVPFGDVHDGTRVERLSASGQQPAQARGFQIISADYFAAVGLKMVRGREFTHGEEESASAPSVAIVDEALAKQLFGDEDPLGQMIRIARSPGEPDPEQADAMQIVGIAPPIREQLLDRRPVSHLYVPFGRHYRATAHFHVRTAPGANERAVLDKVRDEIRSVDPRLPILSLSTMETFHSRSLELWALNTGARTFTMLGLLALTLAVVGVYGVKSYVVAQRTREIGIRLALGATERSVLGLVLRDGFFLTGMGVAFGLPLATLVSFALASVFVDIGGFDAVVISIATIVLGTAATVASGIPARRATKVQPLTALRTE